MCEICRSNPCDARCPNSDAETEPFFCKNCGELITSDDETYIDIFGDRFHCLECALDYHNIQKE